MPRQLNDLDRAEIGRLIADGFTQGIVDANGHRIAWKLEADKYEN